MRLEPLPPPRSADEILQTLEHMTFEEAPPETVAEKIATTSVPYIPLLQAGWERAWKGSGVQMRIEEYYLHMYIRYRGDGCGRENGYSLEIEGLDFTYLYEGVSAEDAMAYVEAIKQALN